MTAPVTLSLIEARPYNRSRLPRRAELRMIEQAFARARAPVVIDARGPADFGAFVERLRDGAVIIHFDGHGYRNARDGDYYLVFEQRRNGLEQPVKLSSVLNSIHRHRDPTQPLLLCLSSCGEMAQRERDAAAACDAIAALIAFDRPVQANIATEFFRTFYGRLAEGESIEASFAQATSGMVGPFCQLSSRPPRWFVPSDVTSVSLRIRTDANTSIIGPELHDAARTLKRTQSRLHEYLVSEGREHSAVAVVGPHDSGRTSMVKSVLQHVSWRFDATVTVEVDPRQAPLSAEALAMAIVQRMPASLRKKQVVRPVAALQALLQPARGRGVAVFVQGIDEQNDLSADAWRLLRQVRAPAVTIVVGTERGIGTHGHVTFRVTPLTVSEARNFFVSCLVVDKSHFHAVMERIEERFERIYQRLGGYPLALHSAAKRVQCADDIDALSQTPPPPSSERWLYRAVSSVRRNDRYARAMSLMALFFGNVPDEQARRIVRDAGGNVLQELVDDGFLGRGQLVLNPASQATVRAYTLHSTLRRALLQADLGRAEEALCAFVVSQPAAVSLSGWTTTWRDSLLSWAANLSERDIAQLRDAGVLASMRRLVANTFDDVLELFEQQWRHGIAAELRLRRAALIERCGDQQQAAEQHLAAVQSFIRAGRLEEAEFRAAEIRPTHHSQEACTHALVLRGDALRRRGRTEDAEQLYGEALSYAQQGSDAVGRANAARGLSDLARERGDFAAALSLLAQVRQAKREMGREWEALEREAYVHKLLRHDGRALWLYQQTIALCPASNSPTAIRCAISSADVLTHSGDFGDAVLLFEDAIARAQHLGNDLLAAEALSRLARSHARAANVDGVADAITRGRELSRQRRIPAGYRALRFRVELAEAAAAVGRADEARRLLHSLTQPGFSRLAGPAVSAPMMRATALVFKFDATHACAARPNDRGVAAHALQKAAAEFARAAAGYRDTGRGWRAVRCELQRAECVRLLSTLLPVDAEQMLKELELDLVVVCRELAEMRDRLRTSFALWQLAEVRKRLGAKYLASRLFAFSSELQHQHISHRDSGELPAILHLPRL